MKLRSIIVLSVAVFATLSAVSAQTTSTWSGGAGNWSPCPNQGGTALWDTCSLSPPEYPAGNFNAVIQGGPVTQNVGTSVVNLTLGSGDSLIITPGYLNITGTSIVNNGSVSIGVGDGLAIQAPSTVTLSGNGSVTIGSGARFWGSTGGGATLINQQTIYGQGELGVGQIAINNQGVINANAGTLFVGPTSMINTGTMEASAGSTLDFANGTAVPYNNTGGTIKALAGGTVQLDNGVYAGGTLTTVGSGVIQASGAAVLNALSNTGALMISSATLEGTITNTGKIEVPSATLFISGNVTLAGSGSLLLSGSGQLQQLDGSDTLTNQQLIHGSGEIFELPLTNQGTIAADSSGNTLSLVNITTTNSGAMEAKNGGILATNTDTVIDNSGGTIEALNASTVILGGRVSGGTLKTSGSGIIQMENGTLDGTINTLTNNGSLQANNGWNLSVEGIINNTGTIALSANGCVDVVAPATLTGSGKLTMSQGNCIYGSGVPFTNQSSIMGAGTIGDSNPMPITNSGTIIASQTSPLYITANASGFTNQGKLTVNAGSTIIINGPFNNLSNTGTLTGGTYSVNGILELQNPVITNDANLTLSGTAAAVYLYETTNSALSSLARNAAKGVLSLQGGAAVTAATIVHNSGKLTVGSGSSLTAGKSYTQTAGTTTVDGTLTAPALSIEGGSLMGAGTLAAAVTSGSTVTVGDSSTKAGILTVTGSYTQQSKGVLNVSIGGTEAGTQYSQLAVLNGASLSGTLNVDLAAGFVPAIGSTFSILTASAVTGQFATANGLSINSGEHFEISYTGSAVTLTAASGQ